MWCIFQFSLRLPFQLFCTGGLRARRISRDEMYNGGECEFVWAGLAAALDKRYECDSGGSVRDLMEDKLLAVIEGKLIDNIQNFELSYYQNNMYSLPKTLTKNELLDWLNQQTRSQGVNVDKIEHLGDGVGFLTLFTQLHPGIIPSTARFIKKPKSEYENIMNLKLLATSLMKVGVNRPIDVICQLFRYQS